MQSGILKQPQIGIPVTVPTGNMSSSSSVTLTDDYEEDETSLIISDYDVEPANSFPTKTNVMKRKTLRKNEGKTIIDESFTESEAGLQRIQLFRSILI